MMSTSDQEDPTEQEEIYKNDIYMSNEWHTIHRKIAEHLFYSDFDKYNKKHINMYGNDGKAYVKWASMRDEEAGRIHTYITKEWNIPATCIRSDPEKSVRCTYEYEKLSDILIGLEPFIGKLTKEEDEAFAKAAFYLWVNDRSITRALYRAKDELAGPHYLINPVIKCFMYMKYPPGDIYNYILIKYWSLRHRWPHTLHTRPTTKHHFIEASDFNIMLYTGIKDYSINGVKL